MAIRSARVIWWNSNYHFGRVFRRIGFQWSKCHLSITSVIKWTFCLLCYIFRDDICCFEILWSLIYLALIPEVQLACIYENGKSSLVRVHCITEDFYHCVHLAYSLKIRNEVTVVNFVIGTYLSDAFSENATDDVVIFKAFTFNSLTVEIHKELCSKVSMKADRQVIKRTVTKSDNLMTSINLWLMVIVFQSTAICNIRHWK